MEDKQKSIFREKSIERVSSPEKLDEYLKVTPIKVWMILSAIIVVLIGVIVWGYFGRLETKVYAACRVQNNNAHCYIKETDVDKVKAGNFEVTIEGQNYQLGKLNTEGIVGENFSSFELHLIDASEIDFLYEMPVSGIKEDGTFKGTIVVETISPLKFIFN